jgi:hypothetical protein
MANMAKPVDKKKEKRKAWFHTGHSLGFHQSYAISTSAALPRELLHEL